MKIAIVTLFAMVALLVLPPLHAKPQDIASLKQQFLFKVLQGMIEEQEEALAQQEEANAEIRIPSPGYHEDMEAKNVAQAMGAELKEALAQQEEANAESLPPGGYYEDMEEENVAQAMGAELEVARARKYIYKLINIS